MKADVQERVIRHGNHLKTIFGIEGDPISLCRKVRRLEGEASKLAENYANGEVTEEIYTLKTNDVLSRLDKILHFKKKGIPVFMNGDPRGYALKIEESYVSSKQLDIERDWGGYGIIAPDLSRN